MNLAFKIARRYLFAKKSTNAINIISAISALGMCFGTLALILVLSVFNGFEGLVTSLYDTFNPDLKISLNQGKVFVPEEEKIKQLEELEGVKSVAMVLEEIALLRYNDKTTPCRLKGVNAAFEKGSGVADTAMIRGKFLLNKGGRNYAVVGLGIERALRIDVFNDFELLDIFMPKRTGKITNNPEEAFNRKSISPVGTFSIQEEFDKDYIFVPLEVSQDLLNYKEGEVSQLEIAFEENADLEKLQATVENILGANFLVKNRYEQDAFLYKVMKTEKLAVFCILALILVVASFNIIGSLSMLVIEKTKDIAILKAMGADSSLIRRIFLTEGFMLSFLGGLIGMIIAFIICFIQQKFEIIPLHGDSLLIDAYPVEMRVGDFLLTLLTIIIIAIAASYFPAQKAAKQSELALKTAD